ncbi:hypothetical protein CVU75_00990 [Candidatus Dependentiae bacterium HGW-Dependentiae-1]|nr:MAG: hypothetical protein CVU75_00990 [Candidatus Dependentiae bacterium HGW-Dependentiae-1]
MKHLFRILLFLVVVVTVVVGVLWWRKSGHEPRAIFTASIAEQKPLVVIIPSYNNERWCIKNLESVFSQKYANYRVMYINDKSKDHTLQLVKKYIDEHGYGDKVDLRDNPERLGAMANLYNAIHSCKDAEIAVILDGDDWFATDQVLARVNQEYANPDVWLTYGQFICYPSNNPGFCKDFPKPIAWANLYRSYTWVATHLRTFYAGLFKKIAKEDLMYEGQFLSVLYDQAIMYPMLEMAGNHVRFIPDVLYVYNQDNPINDGKVAMQRVLRFERMVRRMPRYARLAVLPAALQQSVPV